MEQPAVEVVECDVLVVGGGMSGCGAAFEAAYWAKAKGLKVVIAEKAAVDRSGGVAMGLSAINCYMGMRWGEKRPEEFVRYVRGDLMGLSREDLTYDIARHVDSTVHMFESWGLPFFKDNGRYVREGPWQIMIHGESYKPIVAEAAKHAVGPENVYERIFTSHLLKDERDPNRVAGAVGFSVRDHKVYVFKAKAVIVGAGGCTNVYRPHAVGEGLGRIWYAPWNTGSAYKLMIEAGAKMTQMEHRLVVTRFKDGYGPVGMWFLMFHAVAENVHGDIVEQSRGHELEEWAPYGTSKPVPSPLRNHLMINDFLDGNGPFYLRTDKALKEMYEQAHNDPQKVHEIEAEAWEDFLNMTLSQAHIWASENIDPAERPSELALTEPYLMGSHASGTGAWVSGPADVAPEGYHWGYNRMTTVDGLFAAGDGVGASAHKFSSGSFTEGRLAGKAAVKFVLDNDAPRIDQGRVEEITERIYYPYRNIEQAKGTSTKSDINPHYLLPKQALLRLQKFMDEYAGGWGFMYRTNGTMLERALQLLEVFKEDLENLGARNLHELLRCWEVWDRTKVAEANVRHMLFREETRWPGYYYRLDFPKLDDENWRVFVNSRFDQDTGEWKLEKVPFASKIP